MPLGTPYITVPMLTSAPTGVSWSIIPKPRASTAEITAEITNICWRATSVIDSYCNQVLRATVDNEELSGPGAPRVGIERGTGNGLLIMRRWPVIDVLALQTANNAVWPRVWSTVTPGLYAPKHPLINSYSDMAAATAPDGSATILTAPGIVTWRRGRNGIRLLVSYTNGWPHTSLTADAAAGDSTLRVDDVTGWPGVSGFAYDGAATETLGVASVTATVPLALPNGVGVVQTGPGVITLNSPLASDHAAGAVVSALPANVIWAAVLAAATQALESGITSVTIQNINGSQTAGGHGVSDLQLQYKELLQPFQRVV
jgi:hypothetical protein